MSTERTNRIVAAVILAVGLIAMAGIAQAQQATLPHDLSPRGMFMAADPVVKAVMIGLVFASIVTWTVLAVKSLQLWQASRRAREVSAKIAAAPDLQRALNAVGDQQDPASEMVRLATQELNRSEPMLSAAGAAGLKERVSSYLATITTRAGREIGMGTGLLATIGSTAPFVGLFGTVWGIMNAFIGISETQTTNLAVVAPGIAEALLATALGLVAAIPAVVFYNYFARTISAYRQRLNGIAASIERLVSRDLDHRTLQRAA